ncbi:MAG TPA: hypothetical protein VFV38_10950 [Ktedonobacteraceae bacterium]|nr:hypothetical protein [Ktedonobacteraceae bacterium]
MAQLQKDIADIQAKLQGIIGNRAWGVKHGIGTFITLEFGQPVSPTYPDGKSHGEWHLWVYGGAWRLEKEGRVIVASEDDRTKIEMEIQCIEGCVLQSFEVMTPALDALLVFEDEIVLRIFSIYSEETEERGMDNWLLYTPDAGNVIIVHPGGKWSYLP